MRIPDGTRILYADTSFFYAALDPRDRFHARARTLTREVEERGIGIVTTWEVVVETVTLLRYRHSYIGTQAFIRRVLPRLNLVYLSEAERERALVLFSRMSREHKISLCDAISAVIVKDRLGSILCLTFDDDLRRLGLAVV
jgi:predicted nucleic acid-binding protein